MGIIRVSLCSFDWWKGGIPLMSVKGLVSILFLDRKKYNRHELDFNRSVGFELICLRQSYSGSAIASSLHKRFQVTRSSEDAAPNVETSSRPAQSLKGIMIDNHHKKKGP